MYFEQFRWYYNMTLKLVYQHYGETTLKESVKVLFNNSVRDKIVRKYKSVGLDERNYYVYEYDEDRNEVFIPPWWEGKVHSRVPRGSIKKFVGSINSAISNYRAGNVQDFRMRFMSRKDHTQMLMFEDASFPSFLKTIKSRYWYRNSSGRKIITFNQIFSQPNNQRGLEVTHDTDKDQYYIHYPVDRDWYPEDDIRNDNQVRYESKGNRVISLDPGVRKFLVGYDPSGMMIYIGQGASLVLADLLLQTDTKPPPRDIWRRIRNLVDELHWKTISFLISNYDTILLPEFPISRMVRGRTISKMTKRLMYMFHTTSSV